MNSFAEVCTHCPEKASKQADNSLLFSSAVSEGNRVDGGWLDQKDYLPGEIEQLNFIPGVLTLDRVALQNSFFLL